MNNPMTTHGAVSWSELHATDTERSQAFYTQLFGWQSSTHDMSGCAYVELKVGGRGFGGVVGTRDNRAAWLNYFTVDDVDAACDTARRHGGCVVVGPFEGPPGRMARLADPDGAEFFVIAYRPAG